MNNDNLEAEIKMFFSDPARIEREWRLCKKKNIVKDLISRQQLLDAAEESRRTNHHSNENETFAHEYEHRHLMKLIMSMPTEENKGRWIPGREVYREYLPELGFIHIVYENFYCSRCGFIINNLPRSWDGEPLYQYCNRCGADNRDQYPVTEIPYRNFEGRHEC